MLVSSRRLITRLLSLFLSLSLSLSFSLSLFHYLCTVSGIIRVSSIVHGRLLSLFRFRFLCVFLVDSFSTPTLPLTSQARTLID